MGKHWKNDTSNHSHDVMPNYNAVHYEYKDRKFTVHKHAKFDTKNSLKFREVLKQSQRKIEENGVSTVHESTDNKKHDTDIVEANKGQTNRENQMHKQEKKEKRKKELKKECETTGMLDEQDHVEESDRNECVDKSRKKKTRKKKKHPAESDKKCGVDGDMSDTMEEKAVTSQKIVERKRIKKKKRHHLEEECVSQETADQDGDVISKEEVCRPPAAKKNKKKAKQEKYITEENSVCPEQNTKVKSSKKKKKDKKVKKVIRGKDKMAGSVPISINTEEPKSYTEQKKSSKRKKYKDTVSDKHLNETSEADCPDICQFGNVSPITDTPLSKTKSKMKKRKNKDNNSNTNDEVNTEKVSCTAAEEMNSNALNYAKKSKKKRKERKTTVNATEEEELPEINSSEGASGKKDKAKQKRKHCELNETDSGYPDTEREKDSKGQNGGVSRDCPKAVEGQWGTAQFDSEARHGKFLRLMGGLKTQGGPNMKSENGLNNSRKNAALTSEQESNLNVGLEKQYQTALNWMIEKKKGCGLGFEKDPAEGKKFHINVNKSASKKFVE